MSEFEKALLKGRGRDMSLKYKLRKIHRSLKRHTVNAEPGKVQDTLTQDKKDNYRARTIDWIGRPANSNIKIRKEAEKVLNEEKRKNGHPDKVVTPDFFPSPENISRFLKSRSDKKN